MATVPSQISAECDTAAAGFVSCVTRFALLLLCEINEEEAAKKKQPENNRRAYNRYK
jgi:hypothetical protein